MFCESTKKKTKIKNEEKKKILQPFHDSIYLFLALLLYKLRFKVKRCYIHCLYVCAYSMRHKNDDWSSAAIDIHEKTTIPLFCFGHLKKVDTS